MSRSELSTEFNTFVGGILTEANPINFPVGYSIDEENFILERNGTRRRRLGTQIESLLSDFNLKAATEFIDFSDVQTFTVDTITYNTAYVWRDANRGNKTTDVLVVIYDLACTNVGLGLDVNTVGYLFYSLEDSTDILNNFLTSQYKRYVSVLIGQSLFNSAYLKATDYKGNLIINEGLTSPRQFTFFDGYTGDFGNSDIFYERIVRQVRNYSIDAVDDIAVDERPVLLTQEHAYNLAIRGWDEVNSDAWKAVAGTYPSKADSSAYYKDKGTAFDTTYMSNTLIGTSSAPTGSRLIDPLQPTQNAGSISNIVSGSSTAPELGKESAPSQDGQVIDMTEAFGRVFYLCSGGSFYGLGTTFVMFNNIGVDKEAASCYSTNDPTSEVFNTPLATDGGLIDCSSIGVPYRIVTSRSKLLIFGSKGVFELQVPAGVFSPETLSIRKISSNRVTGAVEEKVVGADTFLFNVAESIVTLKDQFYFWSEAGINTLVFNPQDESYQEVILTDNTIKRLYNEIPSNCKTFARGVYIPEENTIMWMYSSDTNNPEKYQYALMYDATLNAWFKYKFFQDTDTFIKQAIVVPLDSTLPDTPYYSRLLFIAQTSEGIFPMTFKSSDFKDFTNSAAEAEVGCFLQTGYLNANDSAKYKQGTYIVPSFIRTEDGFTDDGLGNLTPTNESSCIISAWWDYAEDSTDNKVNAPFEAYKYNRLYIPEDASDTFDYGQSVITTKNRLTGRGRALSLRFESSVGKDCRLLGWNLGFGAVNRV